MKILWGMLSRGYKITQELHIWMYLSVHTRGDDLFGIFLVKFLLVRSVLTSFTVFKMPFYKQNRQRIK